ncbi:hypothetical protein [Pseudomonas sp. GL-RE-20]|uniref:hypothetical protein n=1 Tax=Pseudomonas sp. GL-RE-20 TaxID=2832372 RepID=UPI001CBAE899|nr:hypothetical protein [Pseudomonas sp. GL-RE-20]
MAYPIKKPQAFFFAELSNTPKHLLTFKTSDTLRLFLRGRNSLIAITLLFTSINIRADWYVIDNYKGSIGPYQIHISLQKYDDYGSGQNIRGSYYYDKHLASIPLYGRYSSSSIELCEIHNNREYETYLNLGRNDGFNMHSCSFKLTKNGDDLVGVWQGEKKSYEVLLKHTSSFDSERKQKITTEKIEIPFWGQTPAHGFIGIYQEDENGAYINKVNIIDKTTGEIVQTFNPQLHGCDFGFFMTTIYQNIESKKERSQVRLNCYSTKSDIFSDYRYDSENHRYLFIDNQ